MQEQILKLREEGKSYREIEKIVGCSKGTVAYHCGEGQKDKMRERQTKRRNSHNGLTKKTDTFIHGSRNRVIKFQKEHNHIYDKNKVSTFTWEDVIEKFGKETKCYLSGEKINLLEDKHYQFDHIIPATRGGSSDLENLGILHKSVNYMKHNLLNEELVEWCIKILVNQGYEVKKI